MILRYKIFLLLSEFKGDRSRCLIHEWKECRLPVTNSKKRGNLVLFFGAHLKIGLVRYTAVFEKGREESENPFGEDRPGPNVTFGFMEIEDYRYT